MKNINIFALIVLFSFALIEKEIKPTSISYIGGCTGQILILPDSAYSLFKLYQVDATAGALGTIALTSFLVATAAYVWDFFSAGSLQANSVKRQKSLGRSHNSLIKTGFWVGTMSGLATLYFLYKKMHEK